MKIEPEALYSLFDTLILPTEKTIKSEKVAAENQTKKPILMLMEKEYNADEKDFLGKILSAINIKPEEVETKFAITPHLLSEIIEGNSGYIIVWGINFEGIESYKFTKKGSATVLLIDSITAIKNDQSLKGKLWNCLKEEFV